MQQIICDFEGWFRIDADKVNFVEIETGETKTAAEWIAEGRSFPDTNLILENVCDAMSECDDLEYGILDISLDDEKDD